MQEITPDTLIEHLELSVRSAHSLRMASVSTVRQYQALTDEEIQAIPNFGVKCQEELAALLKPSPKKGRPSIPKAERRQQIGVRVSPQLKRQIENAAAANGRSVAQETEFRLLQSFCDEDASDLRGRVEALERATFYGANPQNRAGMFGIGTLNKFTAHRPSRTGEVL